MLRFFIKRAILYDIIQTLKLIPGIILVIIHIV